MLPLLPKLDRLLRMYPLDLEAWWSAYATESGAPTDVLQAGLTLARALARWREALKKAKP